MGEPPSPRELFRTVKKLDLLQRFQDAGDVRIAADPTCAEFLKRYRNGAYAALLLEEGSSASARHPDQIIAVSCDDEAGLKHRLAVRFPDTIVAGFIGDAALRAAAHADPLADETGILSEPEPSRLYAVICGPRTGSTWFVNLLRETGRLGRPTEHLRPLIVFMARHRSRFGVDLGRWLALLVRQEQKNGVFGTKVIDDFAISLAPLLDASERAVVQRLAAKTCFIRFRRRDRVAQAVSEYIAEATKVWHVRNSEAMAAYSEAKEAVTYDYQRILASYRRHSAAEATIDGWLFRTGRPALNVVYEDVLAAPEERIAEIFSFLGGATAPTLRISPTRYQRLGDEVNDDMARRFRAEFGLETPSS
ncbi:Stf0 sulfotransferase family protein [Afifella sp. JA880]|uniref:Stf0 sulfotransferase family protein n=1 Tax=Afifella sp. JA880 TaxID=2975280 RepID=UPI0021BAA6B4|nr:Stf0 sulfotransferase family protein [Afifella sp. JA880]MCT8266895.1 Stf0 sulfotransferase family protein [Afifella sp. JA880]